MCVGECVCVCCREPQRLQSSPADVGHEESTSSSGIQTAAAGRWTCFQTSSVQFESELGKDSDAERGHQRDLALFSSRWKGPRSVCLDVLNPPPNHHHHRRDLRWERLKGHASLHGPVFVPAVSDYSSLPEEETVPSLTDPQEPEQWTGSGL